MKGLMLRIDDPVEPEVQELRMLNGRSGGEQGRREADLGRLVRVDRVRAGQTARQVLIAAEDEELVFDDGARAVDGEIGQRQVRLGLAESQQRGARIGIHRPADVVKLAVRSGWNPSS